MDFGNFQYAQCGRLHNKSEYWFRQTESFDPCVKKPIPNMNVYFTKWGFLKHTKVWNDFLELIMVKNDNQKLTSKANIFLTLSQRAHSQYTWSKLSRKKRPELGLYTNIKIVLYSGHWTAGLPLSCVANCCRNQQLRLYSKKLLIFKNLKSKFPTGYCSILKL